MSVIPSRPAPNRNKWGSGKLLVPAIGTKAFAGTAFYAVGVVSRQNHGRQPVSIEAEAVS